MPHLLFITHADVEIDPKVAVPDWQLTARGRARHRALIQHPWVAEIRAVYSSAEGKAREGAQILSGALHCPHQIDTDLHENDRSATGYLPKAAFERQVDAFFARPEQSVQGWESARSAQRRIVTACQRVAAAREPGTSVAIVAHGGVGALLLAWLAGQPISRRFDQPAGQGGHMLRIRLPDWHLTDGWVRIDREGERI